MRLEEFTCWLLLVGWELGHKVKLVWLLFLLGLLRLSWHIVINIRKHSQEIISLKLLLLGLLLKVLLRLLLMTIWLLRWEHPLIIIILLQLLRLLLNFLFLNSSSVFWFIVILWLIYVVLGCLWYFWWWLALLGHLPLLFDLISGWLRFFWFFNLLYWHFNLWFRHIHHRLSINFWMGLLNLRFRFRWLLRLLNSSLSGQFEPNLLLFVFQRFFHLKMRLIFKNTTLAKRDRSLNLLLVSKHLLQQRLMIWNGLLSFITHQLLNAIFTLLQGILEDIDCLQMLNLVLNLKILLFQRC